MLEYYGIIHVYCPGVGTDEPLGPIFFKELLIFSPTTHVTSNDCKKVFPIQMNWRPMLTLPKIGQGHHRVMIYIYIIVL